MAQIFGEINSLSNLINELNGSNIYFLNSLDEIINFKKNFENAIIEIQKTIRSEVLREIEN